MKSVEEKKEERKKRRRLKLGTEEKAERNEIFSILSVKACREENEETSYREISLHLCLLREEIQRSDL